MNLFERTKAITHKRLNSIYNGTTPKQDKTLIIIDMQSEFLVDVEEESILPAVYTLIRHAKKNYWGIIVVECMSSGDTNYEILELLDGYDYWTTVYKKQCDGSVEILQAINSSPRWSLDIVVCGIYGPQCVSATVNGLLCNSTLCEVDVVKDAVYPEYISWIPKEGDWPEYYTGQTENDYTIQARQVKVAEVVEEKGAITV